MVVDAVESGFGMHMIARSQSLIMAFIVGSFLTCTVSAMFDNRYMVSAMDQRPFLRHYRSIHLAVEPCMILANRAYNSFDDNQQVFDSNGTYDLYYLDESLRLAGLIEQSFLRSDWNHVTQIPFIRDGFFSAQGAMVSGYFDPICNLRLGFATSFFHVCSRAQFLFDAGHGNLTLQGPGDEQDLLSEKAAIHNFMGIEPAVWSTSTLGDTDIYARYAFVREYWNKFRYINCGIRGGIIIPSGQSHEINQPLSVPVGGDKHWGVYGMIDAACVLKEDVQAGLYVRVQKRFGRTAQSRFPRNRELPEYGVLTGPLHNDPGFTIGFQPYMVLEHMRGGFGCFLSYTGTFHTKDHFSDKRCILINTQNSANLGSLCEHSDWSTDYVTIGAFYDTACDCDDECTKKPIFMAFWDIPAGMIGGKNAFKSNGLSIRCEVQF